MNQLDSDICACWCSRMKCFPASLEEHEAWHVAWIQMAVSRLEYLKLREELGR